MDDKPEAEGTERLVEVPHAQLAPGVLRRLIEEFVTRDGTDYGAIERTLAEKVAVVMQQLDAGDAAIVVDAEHDTIDIVARRPG
ncbi:MAG: YheU family protein [Myxococcales bacterium]|nr:MAG: YheU family protein [Myxococcales bacterium]